MELDIIRIVLNASLVVKIVIIILVIMSLISWTIILMKTFEIRRTRISNRKFETLFNNSEVLDSLYSETSQKNSLGSMRIFNHGYKEYLNSNFLVTDNMIEVVERQLNNQVNNEIMSLQEDMHSLATFASVAPYIGLFGTVWGVMEAFIALDSIVANNTLSAVAPGISEALVATALGLFVAIPSYIYYNKFIQEIEIIASKFENFANNFITVVINHSNV